MSIDLQATEEADLKAVIRAVAAGRKVDPEVARRVRARAAQITETTRQQHGILNIAVPAIRELRDA